MHLSTLLLIVVAAGAAMAPVAHGHRLMAPVVPRHGYAAAYTPAAKFWEQALPDTPMPDAMADLVQKGIDQSPLVEQYLASPTRSTALSACTLLDSVCSSQSLAETGVYFRMAQLRPGSVMTLFFPSEADSPAILPDAVAETIPFGNVDDVLAAFHIKAGSAEAAEVRDTLRRCQAPPGAGGEVKSCATSLEATVRTALRMIGTTGDRGGGIWAVTSEIPRAGLPRQPYVVQAVTQLAGDKYVSCHRLPFPYAVYQCHAADKAYGSYKVSLSYRGGASQAAVEMVALCHLDTYGWNPAHPAFQVLRTRPGEAPVCHFVTYGNLAFVKKETTRA